CGSRRRRRAGSEQPLGEPQANEIDTAEHQTGDHAEHEGGNRREQRDEQEDDEAIQQPLGGQPARERRGEDRREDRSRNAAPMRREPEPTAFPWPRCGGRQRVRASKPPTRRPPRYAPQRDEESQATLGGQCPEAPGEVAPPVQEERQAE